MAGRPVLLVTGASSGIGEETARQAAVAGYDVVLAARREEPLDALVDELGPERVTPMAAATAPTLPRFIQRDFRATETRTAWIRSSAPSRSLRLGGGDFRPDGPERPARGIAGVSS